MVGKRGRVTLTDVAREANVSPATASKALNRNEHISARTQRTVLQAAQRLGYRTPSTAARESTASGTRLHRSGLVGLVTSDNNGRFALPLLIGAETTLGASNHTALLISSHGRPALERSHIDRLAAYGIDGLIVVGDSANSRPPLKPSTTMGLPVVYAYDPSTDPADCSVVCDNVGAGAQAIEYLVGLDRTHIAIIGGLEHSQATRDRINGAHNAFALCGVRPVEELFDVWSEKWGFHAAAVILERHPDLDAVYCLSDEIARGAVHGLLSAGKRVPQDVAVIGHDNWSVFCTGAEPALTTFDNNITLIGKTAARYLLDAIRGHPRHGVFTVECPMIVRESTES